MGNDELKKENSQLRNVLEAVREENERLRVRLAEATKTSETVVQTSDDIPRRNDLGRMAPSELLIVDAMYAVEAMPADQRLTQASLLLQWAKNLVSDYVDATETYCRPDEPLSPADQVKINEAWERHKAAGPQ